MKKITLFLVLTVLSSLCASAHYYVPRFDPNQDGVSNVADVTDLVDYLLGNTDSGITEESADVDGNGRIRISDVTLMIDYMLNPDYFDDPQYGPLYPDPVIPEGSEVFTVNGVSFAMVPVDTVDEDGNLVHKFSLGLTEVTDGLWQAVMGSSPTHGIPGPRWPVQGISWYDAYEFIDSLNKLTGREFRLPLAEEWEYAARGGLLFHQYQYAGSDDINEVAWCHYNLPSEDWKYAGCAVGLKAPNELGFYDMSGNAYEWCHNIYGKPESNNIFDEAQIVGGGVNGYATFCLISYSMSSACVAYRTSTNHIKGSSYGNFGMRLAL